MAERYEYYITGDDGWDMCYLTSWNAQTFTPSTAHKITSVKLLLFRVGSPGTVTVSIQGVDVSDHPDGTDLCSGTTSGNTLTEDTAGEWREITLGAGADLDADTKYAIVIRVLDGTIENYVSWRYDSTDPTYAGGCYEYSSNSGVEWTSYTDRDFMFEEWGEAIAPSGLENKSANMAAKMIAGKLI